MKKNITTGTGLFLLAGAIVAFPFAQRLAGSANEAHAGTAAATGLAAASLGQVTPTVVWYGMSSAYYPDANSSKWLLNSVTRAWSDGRVEMKIVRKHLEQYQASDRFCNSDINCDTGWRVISDPNQGFASSADLNFDQQVDGADLGTLLAFWGAAPRHDLPPSDCPLNLVNP